MEVDGLQLQTVIHADFPQQPRHAPVGHDDLRNQVDVVRLVAAERLEILVRGLFFPKPAEQLLRMM